MSTTDIQQWHLFNLYRSSFQQARDHFLLGCFFFSSNTTGRSSHLCGAQCERHIGKRAVDLFIDLAELQNKIKHSLTKKSSGMWKKFRWLMTKHHDHVTSLRYDPHSLCHIWRKSIPKNFWILHHSCWILLASAARIEKPSQPSPSVERCELG